MICSPGSAALGQDMGTAAGLEPLGLEFAAQAPATEWDLAVDFSLAEADLTSVEAAAERGKPAVVGVTALSQRQQDRMRELASDIPLLYAANFTAGIALLNRWARIMRQLAQQADAPLGARIAEIHHASKKDKPSGTALALARHLDLPAEQVQASRTDDIGDECEHRVWLELDGEKIEVIHRAPRRCFAAGALQAGRWLVDQPAGLYDMEDAVYGCLESEQVPAQRA